MFLGGAIGEVPGRSTALHLSVFRRIRSKLDHFFIDMNKLDRNMLITGSFKKLTSPNAGHRFPKLRAHDDDVLEVAGSIDPTDSVPMDI